MKRLAMFSALALPLSAEVESVAHPTEKFPAGATVVWTPLFQAAWDRLNAYHGGKPVKVEPPNELISRLDAFAWKAGEVMPEDRWKVWAGPATEEFLAEANAGAAEMTGEARGPFRLVNRLPGMVAVFGLLDREVVFEEPFYRSRKVPMTFTTGTGEGKEVKFFGVKGVKGEESGDMGKAVRVLAYRPTEKCHALQILCRDGDDTVVLFRPPEVQDFATACEWLRTWRKAWKPEPGSSFKHDDRFLHEDDEVRAPYVKLEAVRDFAGELDSLRFYKGQELPRRIARAEQRVEFELHERGARVRAEVSSEDSFGGLPEVHHHPRRFAYDAPFFVFLWRDGAEWPYFGAWVGDASAMEEW